MNPQLITLSNENLQFLIKQHEEELRKIPEVDLELDLSKEFRFKNYPVILLLLKNALRELVSSAIPHPDKEYKETKQKGYLYLYDGRVPNYMNDGIQWKKTRMSVKLIVFNKSKGIYKLKNHKNDVGNAVMRRQTWQGNGWRKNEYKLINRETYYKPEADGSFSVNECQTLQDFPVLVHYFRKNDSTKDGDSGSVRSGKKRKTEDEENDNNNGPCTTAAARSSSSIFDDDEKPFLLTPLPSSPSLLLSFTPSSPDGSFHSTKDEMSMFNSDFFQMAQQLSPLPIITKFTSKSTPIPMAVPTPSATIKRYAPESAASVDTTKVIVVIDGFPFDKICTYSCMFGGNEIPATVVVPGVLEMQVPPHDAGIVQFWMMCRESGSKNVLYSNAVFFYYTPSDEAGQLSLAMNNLQSDALTTEMLSHFRHTVKELDLSNNLLTDMECIANFNQLHTLVLDNNHISSTSKFPPLPKLTTLYVNCNLITDLQVFLNTLKNAFPNLQHLSLLGNEGCPCFSKAPHHYYNYRIFVISKLRKLTQLDSSPVTPEEWRHAACIISDDDVVVGPSIANQIKRELL